MALISSAPFAFSLVLSIVYIKYILDTRRQWNLPDTDNTANWRLMFGTRVDKVY